MDDAKSYAGLKDLELGYPAYPLCPVLLLYLIKVGTPVVRRLLDAAENSLAGKLKRLGRKLGW